MSCKHIGFDEQKVLEICLFVCCLLFYGNHIWNFVCYRERFALLENGNLEVLWEV